MPVGPPVGGLVLLGWWVGRCCVSLSRSAIIGSMAKPGPNPRPLEERFSEKFISIGTGGCWPWTAATNYYGYGKISVSRSHWDFAHRVAWPIHYGEIPDNMLVLHRCDNPLCVNPSHLFLGTQNDNLQDMQKKGRKACGERHGQAKLSDAQIDEIRSLGGTMLQRDIAEIFGTGRRHVGSILSGKRRG